MQDQLKIILNFFLLIAVQVLILNNIQLFGLINPYLYILFIITLPMSVSTGVMMLIAFLLGGIIDMFSNSYGMHMSASVLVAFIRPYVMGLFASREDMEKPAPTYRNFGVSFFKYATSLVFIHHFVLFFLEAFSFSHFGVVLLKTLCSGLVTMLLIFGIQTINFKRR
ncbi:MAG TPA: rod shape-determining protein MreD [Paludibacteraceae bacterium]|jgi:rod shape-determining protein MreD|nr:rod shape-determining protein MreD [Paludibacteraceae bacterium]HQB68724.1 rod shape-determining protein MreD [Paludibacteraceae bacterium]HRS67275.1 rod shape-determining protein MreD [Paludibacteraceae bacterium]